MTHEESWNAFIDELRTYVQEHHHFPNKHTRLLSKVKYSHMRDMEEHTGGRKVIELFDRIYKYHRISSADSDIDLLI